MFHAVHDFRALLRYLERSGAPRAGVTGLSLGGYICGLLAAVEPGLDFVIPNAPVSAVVPLLSQWYPASVVPQLARRALRLPEDDWLRAMNVHSPLNYAPIVPKDRLMVVGGLGDRLAPPEQSILLWEHWDRPSIHWFLGSHVMHFGRRGYLQDMRELMSSGGGDSIPPRVEDRG
jgi:hypothetical protein